jgi:hypothetical protein
MHKGHLSFKPGWVRMSIHPLMTNEEIEFILDAIEQVALHYQEWKTDYLYDEATNEYHHKSYSDATMQAVDSWYGEKLV